MLWGSDRVQLTFKQNAASKSCAPFGAVTRFTQGENTELESQIGLVQAETIGHHLSSLKKRVRPTMYSKESKIGVLNTARVIT